MEILLGVVCLVLLITSAFLLYRLSVERKRSFGKDFIINKARVVSRKMYELGNREDFIQEVCRTVKTITNSDEFVYFRFDEQEQYLLPEFTDGPYKEQLNKVKVRIGEGFSGYVAQERRGMILNDANNSPISKHVPGTPDEESSLLAIPILFSGDLLGVILQTKLGGKRFTREELNLSEIFVNLAAGFIAGEKSLQRIREGFLETLRLLVSIVELKDTYTAGHSVRVSEISELIARKMGLPESDVLSAKYGGLLHDVGKIGIKEELLRKRGLLDEIETTEVRKHSEIGAEIISKVKMFDNVVNSVKHHHEWFNGTGYPDSLKGKAIPMPSRIIMIADAIDAMTSGRPGKRVYSIEETFEELKKFSGIQFDPEIVEAVLKLDREICKIVKEGVIEEGENAKKRKFSEIS